MTDFINVLLLPALTAGGVTFAILKYLSRTFLQHQLTKDIARYRAELDEKSAVLKNQLSIFAHEHTVAISRIDEQTAKAIHIVYKALRAWVNPATYIVSGCPIRNATIETTVEWYDDIANKAHNAGRVFYNICCDHAIYFDADVFRLLAKIGEIGPGSIAVFLSPIRQGIAEGNNGEDILQRIEQNRQQFTHVYQDDLMPLMQKLTAIFRVMLGVEKPLPEKNIPESIKIILNVKD